MWTTRKKFDADRTVAFAALIFAALGAASALGAAGCANAKKDDNAASQAQALANDAAAVGAIANATSDGAAGSAASAAGATSPAPRPPPPQMFDACMGKAASDACQVTFTGTRAIDGVCTESLPPETRLVCHLKNPGFFGNRPHHGPLPGMNGPGQMQPAPATHN